MEIIPDKRKLVGLVEQAHKGELCLPDFQRSFVWEREQVADLLRSLLRRYFVGTLLLLRCDPQNPPFAPLPLRGADSVYKEPRPALLALDGQQRLTSLLYALTAPDLGLKNSIQQRHFFVDLTLLTEDPYDDEIVFDLTDREVKKANLQEPEAQFQRRVLPCTKLLKHDDYLSWRDDFDDWLKETDPEDHERFRKELRGPWTKTVTDFQNFEVPLVELPAVDESDPDSIGRVCAIFEKLNSTGAPLSVYDLLTARLYRSNIRLHELWEQACKEHRRLASWSGGDADKNKFGVLMLRTLALVRGLDPKPRILINLSSEAFEEDWRRSASAIERALELVENVGPDGFGVFDPKWLPGFGLLPILAALRLYVEERGLGEGPRADLRRWYWCNVFLERYSSAVESKSRKDYQEMTGYWTKGGLEPAVFGEARVRIGAEGYTVRPSASYASAVYSGVFCLLALGGARDWARGESIQLQELQDHHVFPRAYLRRHGIETRWRVNSIANRTLISDQTNKLILDKAPAEYLKSPAVFPGGADGALLAPHFLDGEALDVMAEAAEGLPEADAADFYEWFCRARERRIVEEIRRVCGVDTSGAAKETDREEAG